jgi:hypothetical protein
MDLAQILGIILSALAVIFTPVMVMLYRGIVKWTRTEDKLDHLIEDVDTLIKDKERTHQAMLQQMTDDRRATDRRLRWLEENIWTRNAQK